MNELSRKALGGMIKLQLALALLIFLPAWSLDYWQAWVYWFIFAGSVLPITLYFLRHDPGLIARRIEVGPGAEHEAKQKVIQTFTSVFLLALYVVSGLDHRLHWSFVSMPIVMAADVIVASAFLIIFLVFRENGHASAIVKVEADQRVISTGPYRLVRHPMYSGSILLFLATPFALGSHWALLAAFPLCALVVVRLLDEERFLSANLEGYRAYCRNVRSRLLPMVW